MDIAGATKVAKELLLNPEMASSAPFITSKTDWSTQINGAYNLLFPFIHVDYPVRTEVISYVVQKITDAFKDHNQYNYHFGAYSSPGIDVPVMPTQMDKFTLEQMMIKIYVNDNGTSEFQIDVKNPTTGKDAKIASIGYGV